MKLSNSLFAIIILFIACSEKKEAFPIGDLVQPPPTELNIHPFYNKYIDANGIPVISSENVRDEALIIARDAVNRILSLRADIKHQYIKNSGKIAVIGVNELTTDIPEYRDLYEVFPGTDWNVRARGLGATLQRPVSSVGEENLICQPSDRYHGEDILTHELAHGLLNLGIKFIEPEFEKELQDAFENAKSNGLWEDTYAITSKEEYFAEGVQSWFNVNKEAEPPNGIHNFVNTRNEIEEYDPFLYELISRYFPEENGKISCHFF